jgi:uncharacterized protein YidB (DUF937 family)
MDFLGAGEKLLQSSFGDSVDAGAIKDAVEQLIGDQDGGIDLQGMVSKLSDSGMGDVVQSWLGDGENSPIDAGSVKSLLGQDKIEAFASKLNIDSGDASEKISDMLPQLIDQFSSGGQLLNSSSMISSLMQKASNFLSGGSSRP